MKILALLNGVVFLHLSLFCSFLLYSTSTIHVKILFGYLTRLNIVFCTYPTPNWTLRPFQILCLYLKLPNNVLLLGLPWWFSG